MLGMGGGGAGGILYYHSDAIKMQERSTKPPITLTYTQPDHCTLAEPLIRALNIL